MELTQHHPSEFKDFRYVYPVLSRRAGGVSVGINLNPAGSCTFDCVYCQVQGISRDRLGPHPEKEPIDIEVLEEELHAVLSSVIDGTLYEDPWFSRIAPEKRILKDIAFAGDGEPTISPKFPEAVAVAASVRDLLSLESLKIVLITNATVLQKSALQNALEMLYRSGGEVWAKLDAGTESVFQRINRTRIPFKVVLDNIKMAGKQNPIVIQSCFFMQNGELLPDAEIAEYTARLNEIVNAGAVISCVQVYTVARLTSESDIDPVPDDRLDAIGETVRKSTDLRVEVFYSR